jgi:hypothetical protein
MKAYDFVFIKSGIFKSDNIWLFFISMIQEMYHSIAKSLIFIGMKKVNG